MPRDLPIGNGSLLINFDHNYYVRDIYYPNVGGIEHTLGHLSRLGIWTEEHFSWVNSHEWEKTLRYNDDSLVTQVTAKNQQLGILITINDAVDFQESIYLRKITLKDLSNRSRQIRLFLSHDLHLSESKVGDTAYFDPRTKSIIHYKRDQYFLINCLHSEHSGIEDYAVGIQDFRGAEGTWRDAEDGKLSGDAVADGSVDSTIGMHLSIPANNETSAYYWMIAGKSYDEVSSLNKLVITKTPEHFINRTDNYWKSWIIKGWNNLLESKLPDSITELYKKSLLILRTQIDNGGAITAGNDLDTAEMGMDKYSYMWPRDGAMIAYALDKAGYPEITEKFFRFCANVITPDGYALHKYHPDGTVGSTWHPWVSNGQTQLPIQEDGTALIVWAFWHHFQEYQDMELLGELYEPLVAGPGNFMLKHRDEVTGLPLPSYDLWEERYGVHIYTTTAVCAGLMAASDLAVLLGEHRKAVEFRYASEAMKKAMDKYLYSDEYGRFVRTVYPESGGYKIDPIPDSSLHAIFAFDIYDAQDPRVKRTMDAIRDNLTVKTLIGGIARYKNDYLHRVSDDFTNVPGNPWFICTLWMAQYLIAKSMTITELNEALPLLEWVAKHALESGVLPEQLHPNIGVPLSISPLSWSHGEFILTVHKFLEKLKILNS